MNCRKAGCGNRSRAEARNAREQEEPINGNERKRKRKEGDASGEKRREKSEARGARLNQRKLQHTKRGKDGRITKRMTTRARGRKKERKEQDAQKKRAREEKTTGAWTSNRHKPKHLGYEEGGVSTQTQPLGLQTKRRTETEGEQHLSDDEEMVDGSPEERPWQPAVSALRSTETGLYLTHGRRARLRTNCNVFCDSRCHPRRRQTVL